MTRGMFTGSRMSGTIGGKTKRRSAQEQFMAARRGESTNSNMSQEDRYKQIFEEKIEELRKKAQSGATFSANLPGASMETRKLSANAQKQIDIMINKRARKYAKSQSRMVTIVPKLLTGIQGGRIDKRGAIMGPDGRWIATIDRKTGKVRSRRGLVICKYNPKSTVSEFRIAQFIQNEYRRNKGSIYAARGHGDMSYGIYGQAGVSICGESSIFGNHADHGFMSPLHGNGDAGVWGHSAAAEGGGSVWGNAGGGDGHGGGGVWGNGGGSVWG